MSIALEVNEKCRTYPVAKRTPIYFDRNGSVASIEERNKVGKIR